eukprot:TRINITY_DN62614_c0_g1_i1.p1 TRINITY_DN62614_c0_g1~~TRINITY_DN62614_c0_g1_i1.p1  ORF type:complete len:173 (+),score=23.20 TRINITY_DN62614_c0_g1_i1:70-588(+)
MSMIAPRVPVPPRGERPQRPSRRPLVGVLASPPGSAGSAASASSLGPPRPPGYSPGAGGITPRWNLTPRNLPPLEQGQSHAVASSFTPEVTDKPRSAQLPASAASTAPPTPEARHCQTSRESEQEASAAKAAELLTQRKATRQGGRSFFKWSFRSRGSTTSSAQRRYEVADG